jgi:L-lactate dehydrogenase complex protein LldG
VYDVKDALISLQKKYNNQLPSFLTLATGPSRTADIEKTLVVGVHGPKEVFVFLVDAAEQ